MIEYMLLADTSITMIAGTRCTRYFSLGQIPIY